MAFSVNKVELIGRVGKDPEVKELQNGPVANFSVATSESWKDKDTGDWKEKTEWHNIAVWNKKTIEYIERNIHKGDLVRIEGKIQTRSWEKDGEKKYATDIVIPMFAGMDALMKMPAGNGSSNDERGDSRGSSSRSRSRDDDDRGNSRSSSRSRDDDADDRRSSSKSAPKRVSADADMEDDEIPF